MNIHERYLRWVFGESRYRRGVRTGDYVLLPLYTPLALIQDIELMLERRDRKRRGI
jgi:ABC-type transporter lipoprotein component MlaA